ncbi:MAG: helix-hairpin-helix domain-containing protein [Bacteroidetes bacterium]|nr:helix-hairpin-helix domain-containing protein [Bacteroidota bacterium]
MKIFLNKIKCIAPSGKQFFRFPCSVLLFIFLSDPLLAQENKKDDATEQKIENITETINQGSTSDKEIDYTTLLDQLNAYKDHPLNLNTASRENLENIVLLNDLQVQALLDHIDKYGKLISIEELQSIDGFDLETIYNILPFVHVNDIGENPKLNLKNMLANGKSAVFIRWQQVLEEQKGFSPKNESTGDTHRYYGSPAKLYARYRFSFNEQISFGITAEKDPGEEFFSGTQKNGFDFYSAHLYYHGDGWLKSLAAGDFQAQYGQGLVLWSGLAFGKSADVMNIKKNARGILPYTSVDENLFLRGGAVSLGYKKFRLDLFHSDHKILTKEDIISSFDEDGYHRDSSELSKKHTIEKTISGGHVHYTSKKFSIGVTGFSTGFSSSLEKTFQPYNRFDFSGNRNTNAGIDYNYVYRNINFFGGIDYNYVYRNINFFGEFGKSKNGGVASINGILAALDQNVSVSILHRHFDKDYQALESNALAENSNVVNEDGLYFGIFLKPARRFSFNAYYDQFSFPWLRFSVDAPSAGKEYLAQLNYNPTKTFEAYVRIKQQNKPANISADTHPVSNLQDVAQVNYRFHVSYAITTSVSLANRVEIVRYQKGNNPAEKGFMLYQDLNYQPFKSRYSFSARYVLFDTDTYNTRIYAFESDVLYAYSIPSYYYRGSRFYVTAHYRMMRGIDFWLRYGTTVYDSQQTVGSGLDQIAGNQKSEVKAQVRFQF